MTEQSQDDSGRPFPAFRYGATQKIAYTDTAGVIANGVSDRCRLVLVWCSTDAHIAVGAAPVATTDDKPVTAKADTPVVLQPGEKISAIQQTDAGTLYVTELL